MTKQRRGWQIPYMSAARVPDFESGASASSATPASILLRVFGLLRPPILPVLAQVPQVNRHKTAAVGRISDD